MNPMNRLFKKRIKIIVLISLIFINFSYSQQIPTNNNPSAPGASGINSQTYWSRVGNTDQQGNNNIFGTRWNSPIYTMTDSQNRMRLSGTINTSFNGSIVKSFSGFLGLSPTGYFNNNMPLTMLHLYGPNNSPQFGAGGGWRQWMNTGLLSNENSDGMYVGMKQEGTNRSDAIINWSDDPSGGSGPDKLRFIHTGGNTGNGNGQTDPRDPFALNGYEYMRMTAEGALNSLGHASGIIGIGPLFGNSPLTRPQARLHINAEDSLTTYLQITVKNRTGQNFNDGLRFGILGQHAANQQPLDRDGNGLLYNQEQRHLLFSTGFATPTNINASRERVRFTHIEAPTNLPTGLYGIHNPANLPLNRTRVAITYDPLNPITRPMSLLHLGSNTNYQLATNSYDGWRNWMDVGMFISRPFDHMYFGLKQEPGLDRYDAIIGWGNESDTAINGPDVMRFIFTKTPSLTSTEQSTLNDGLECMRIYPGRDTTSLDLFPNRFTYGRVGIGDFSVNGLNVGPTHKLDVDGNARLRLLPDSLYKADSTVLKYVMVDSLGVLRWSETAPSGNNIGHYCSDTINTNPLTDNFEIPLNNFNYYFADPAGSLNQNENFVLIGDNCGTPIDAKLEVHRGLTNNTQFLNYGGLFLNNDISQSLAYTGNGIGVAGFATGDNRVNSGVGGYAARGRTNAGGNFRADDIYNSSNNTNITNFGVQAFAGNGNSNVGISSSAFGTAFINTGGDFNSNSGTNANIGIRASTGNTGLANVAGFFNIPSPVSGINIGVYSQVLPFNPSTPTNPPTTGNFAGYFDGDVYVSGTVYGTTPGVIISDQSIKTNIDTLSNALSIIEMLKPRSFNYDANAFPEMSFPTEKQYGFIAQDVETILPDLVKSQFTVTNFDSLGNIINNPQLIKNLNYNSFIAILTKGIQELKNENDVLSDELNTQDSINNALQDQINTLYGMITACCSNNSNLGTGVSINSTTGQQTLDVTLNDAPSIVLDQNVPNPFAEQTTITYSLVDGVQKAQMLFYNIEGKLIQSVNLTPTGGKGQINVFANDLSTGVYTYTLVVDGEIKGTKRMVKE